MGNPQYPDERSKQDIEEAIMQVMAIYNASIGAPAQPLCVNCGLTGYEHIDHEHVPSRYAACPFGDCDGFDAGDSNG